MAITSVSVSDSNMWPFCRRKTCDKKVVSAVYLLFSVEVFCLYLDVLVVGDDSIVDNNKLVFWTRGLKRKQESVVTSLPENLWRSAGLETGGLKKRPLTPNISDLLLAFL